MERSRPALPAHIYTVTSRDYLPGTHVMLQSFLEKNPWFSGQINILQDDLSDSQKEEFSEFFEQIHFPDISPDLSDAIGELVAAQNQLADRRRRFYSLEAFFTDAAGPVLFCDSDMLFRADISAMFEIPGSLVACGDRAQITGSGRDPVTLAETAGSMPFAGFSSFNAGLMVIGKTSRSADIRAALMGELDPENWAAIASDHTDQAVLNRVLGSSVSIAPAQFNYLVGHASALKGAAGVSAREAKVLHFNGPAKPWAFAAHMAAARHSAEFVWAAGQWFDSYRRYLAARHLR
ncbi:glycosyltransferase family 8 protein [Pontixanthobacter luteolus]|uniref:glycosyltransferase family 8 protein n=1 Tax=Pontixanthobacter luteolus TaxID=295089 RepID=UPI0023042359|nr:glycosyltransferase [Pontixanthobacter luteolus]